MKLISKSIVDKELINSKYTCDGADISPNLSWQDFPVDTKSFALICHDPDSPSGNFIHWAIANIPAQITNIEEGVMQIQDATNLINDFGNTLYGGPCPGSGTHRYVFSIYALSIKNISDINSKNFLEKIGSYILDEDKLIGLYKRK